MAQEVDLAVAAASAEVIEAADLAEDLARAALITITEDFTEDIGDLAVTDTAEVVLEECSQCSCSPSSL